MKKSDIIKNGLFYMGMCPVGFRGNQEVINKCISSVGEFTRKAYENNETISETGYIRAIELILLDNINKNPDWHNIGGKADKDFAGESCMFGENLTDCGIRHARKYSLLDIVKKNKEDDK